jgi:predicted TIM-barrel fold metal-dependent hydrolase
MIYGLGLPEAVLKKVYADNAARLLRLPLTA